MVQVKDRVVFILSLLSEKGSVTDGFISFTRLRSFFSPGYRIRNLYSTLGYSVKIGDVKKIHRGSEVFYQLTEKGKRKFQHDFPLVSFNKRKWDKQWRVLIYDIPDARKSLRETLRRTIISLGFGKLQNSIYISPFPIEKIMVDFLDKNSLNETVLFMSTDTIFSGGDKYLAESIWKLARINGHYRRIWEELKDHRSSERDLQRLRAEFVGVLTIDPFLPEELLPKPWYREETLGYLFKK